MSSSDEAPQAVVEKANEISIQVGELWLLALAEGMRQGIEFAVKCIEFQNEAWREGELPAFIDESHRQVILIANEGLITSLRLQGLRVEDPVHPARVPDSGVHNMTSEEFFELLDKEKGDDEQPDT